MDTLSLHVYCGYYIPKFEYVDFAALREVQCLWIEWQAMRARSETVRTKTALFDFNVLLSWPIGIYNISHLQEWQIKVSVFQELFSCNTSLFSFFFVPHNLSMLVFHFCKVCITFSPFHPHKGAMRCNGRDLADHISIFNPKLSWSQRHT